MNKHPHDKTHLFTTACALERPVARSSAHGRPHMHIDSWAGNRAMPITSLPARLGGLGQPPGSSLVSPASEAHFPASQPATLLVTSSRPGAPGATRSKFRLRGSLRAHRNSTPLWLLRRSCQSSATERVWNDRCVAGGPIRRHAPRARLASAVLHESALIHTLY